jgi:hypothetical protein
MAQRFGRRADAEFAVLAGRRSEWGSHDGTWMFLVSSGANGRSPIFAARARIVEERL